MGWELGVSFLDGPLGRFLMPRDSHIPLFLWIATALLVHLLGGGGANKTAEWLEERLELRRFAEGVRSYVRASHGPTEIALLEEAEPPPRASEQAEKPPDPEAETAKDKDDDSDAKERSPEKELQKEPEKPDAQPTEAEKKPEEKPEAPSEKEKKPIEAQELLLKKRIAVRQHVKDKDQAENADADLISEHNNRVREETQSRLTANDQNDAEPTPGSSASGSADQPGDSHETRIAESEDRAGEEARPPSDEPAPVRDHPVLTPPNAGAPQAAQKAHEAPSQAGAVTGVEKPPSHTASNTPSPGSKGQAEQQAQPGAPELMNSSRGSSLVAEAKPATLEQKGQQARKKRELPRRKIRGYESLLGLGASGTTASGVNLNLTPGLARDAIGMDQLSKERRADGARRRSAHLGSWKTTGIERWRSAIENYVPSVKPGNQTALNTARSPFGTYLSLIHNRLHPIFADWFLASLDALPANHAMNKAELSTNLEIVLDQDEGRIVRMGVTKTSGVTAFDVAALDSVQRASPFGPPPREILSPDGNVYLHWEFHRNPVVACTTFNARPYMLKVQPKSAPPPIPPPSELPAPDERHGSLPRDSERRLSRAK